MREKCEFQKDIDEISTYENSPATADQKNGKTKWGEEEKSSNNSDIEPGAGKVGGAEGEDGGDEGDGGHPDRAGGAQVADVLLPQGG